MAKIKEKAAKNAHKDCSHCTPFTEGFLNQYGEPILGDCDIVPHKVMLNELTSCKQWQNRSK
jgi:hypothetical protein